MITDNEIWYGLFIVIIIITLGFIIISFAAADQSIQEFSKNVAIILIPIVAGVIATKFTADSWYITKEKIAIKQNILCDYADSYKKMSILHDNFMFNVIENYVIFTDTGSAKPFNIYSREKFGIQAFLPNSIEQTNLPKEKCKNEFIKLQSTLYEASILQNKLFSGIRLHFDDKNLEGKINELKDLIDDQAIIIQRFMNSSSANEVEEFFNKYMDTIVPIKCKFEEVELIMINLKFREITL